VRLRRAAWSIVALAAAAAIIGPAGSAFAAGPTATLRLDPSTQNVANGGTFSVKVIQNASVPTSGTAVTITFNKSIAQVSTITRGAAFAQAPLYLAADATAIANANKSGKLKGVAAAFFPPGSVPAGDQEFITIGFKAVGCGALPLAFALDKRNDGMLDGRQATYGASLKITGTTGASATVCDASASQTAPSPGASLEPGASVDAGASPSFDAGASASPDANASAVPGQSAPAGGVAGAVTPSQPPSGGSGGSVSDEQAGWLTFALAGLAVAAAGLALLIVVIVLITIVAATVAAYYLLRAWRRSVRGAGQPAAAAATAAEAAPAGDATGVEPDAPEPVHDAPGVPSPAANPSAG
jgi:hypothetical protein